MILQFGTSRFLQAHVDLFVSESLDPGPGEGPITVVQTTGSAERAARVQAFNAGRFPVRLRGLIDGSEIDRVVEVRSVRRGLSTAAHWQEVVRLFVEEAQAVVCNTGDRGYDLDPADRPGDALPPRSFPAKLLVLLHARFRADAPAPAIYPCELISGNGDALQRVVLSLAKAWSLDPAFIAWIGACRFVNSLVDRIVSAPIEPVGAVAEPYALWAIESRLGLTPICRHPDIFLADRLADFEHRKLFILNLGHTALVEFWRERGDAPDLTVREAVADPDMRGRLESLYAEEVIPVFAALGQQAAAADYRARTLERFANPFLDHRLADIAVSHNAKRERRFGGLLRLAEAHGLGLRLPWLRAHA